MEHHTENMLNVVQSPGKQLAPCRFLYKGCRCCHAHKDTQLKTTCTPSTALNPWTQPWVLPPCKDQKGPNRLKIWINAGRFTGIPATSLKNHFASIFPAAVQYKTHILCLNLLQKFWEIKLIRAAELWLNEWKLFWTPNNWPSCRFQKALSFQKKTFLQIWSVIKMKWNKISPPRQSQQKSVMTTDLQIHSSSHQKSSFSFHYCLHFFSW